MNRDELHAIAREPDLEARVRAYLTTDAGQAALRAAPQVASERGMRPMTDDDATRALLEEARAMEA